MTEAEKKLQAHMDLKRKNEEELMAFKASGDVETLKAWGEMGYKQPAPSPVQELKNKLGLSWRGLKKFIENL